MDLGTMRGKLEKGEYKNPWEVSGLYWPVKFELGGPFLKCTKELVCVVGTNPLLCCGSFSCCCLCVFSAPVLQGHVADVRQRLALQQEDLPGVQVLLQALGGVRPVHR